MSVGDLRERIRFEQPNADQNGYGGQSTAFEFVFNTRGGYMRLRGSETVIAARQAGKQPTIIRVYASSESRSANNGWRIVDRDTGETFNIRSVSETKDNRFLDFYTESGVAT
ncbi:MAG: phage head closure protein [bacterium]|nr:phage head closure protein [bacterium]